MTTIAQAEEGVFQAFVTGWGARTVYQLEGSPFSDGTTEEPGPDVEWIRVVVRNRTGTTNTMGDAGSKRHLRNAAVIMSAFTPADHQGTKALKEHAQFALDIFESKNITVPSGGGVLDFIAGDVREVPLEEDAKNRQINIEIPFDFSETK